MNPLAVVDLEGLRLDSEGFLGQAFALGMKYDRLPQHAPDVLLAYLRTEGARFGRRYRTGIAVSRDVLVQGVRQALVSLELGLTVSAGNDLNRAVDLLAKPEFEKIRKRGWEEAYVRLEEMRRVCRSISGRPEAHLLQDCGWQIDRWSRVVPETWTVSGAEDDEVAEVDPLQDYPQFLALRARLSFMRLLPSRVLRPFAVAVDECGFRDFLRHLVLALALERDRLVPDASATVAFESECFGSEGMAPWARDKVMRKVEEMACDAVDDSNLRMLLVQDVAAEIDCLEELAAGSLADHFVTDA